jgi:hypothetical protein
MAKHTTLDRWTAVGESQVLNSLGGQEGMPCRTMGECGSGVKLSGRDRGK